MICFLVSFAFNPFGIRLGFGVFLGEKISVAEKAKVRNSCMFQAMKAYMECLKANKYESEKCRKFSKDYLECRMERNLMVKQDLSELGFFKEGSSTGQNKGLEAPFLKQSPQQDGQGSVSISGTLKHSQQEGTESIPNAGTLKQSSQHDGRAGFISGLPKRAAAKSS
jgi:hypothetical protein